MPTETPVAATAPRMIAFNEYKETDVFKNTRHWTIEANTEENADGVLWAAFIEGYAAGKEDTLQEARKW